MGSIAERPPRRWVLPILLGGFAGALLLLPIVAALVAGSVLALAGVVVFGRTSWRSGALLVSALLLGLSAVEAIAGLIVPSAINRTVVKKYQPHRWTIDDPAVGYRPRPGEKVQVEARYGNELVFRRTYTIEPSGARATAGPRGGGPTYLFIGDSFIFGEGLPDSETLPSKFAALVPQGAHVVNLGVLGYGPNHLVRALETGLYDPHVSGKVAAVFTWLALVQLPRVTGDGGWLGSSPRYVLDGSGVPRHTGSFTGYRLRDPIAGLSYLARSNFAAMARAAEPALERERADLYVALIARLRDLVRERYGAPLVLLYDWPDREVDGDTDQQYLPIFRAVQALDIPLVSVRKVMGPVDRWPEFVIPHDSHPNSRLTAGLAAELAAFIDRQEIPR
jgi:hypothetical protein